MEREKERGCMNERHYKGVRVLSVLKEIKKPIYFLKRSTINHAKLLKKSMGLGPMLVFGSVF